MSGQNSNQNEINQPPGVAERLPRLIDVAACDKLMAFTRSAGMEQTQLFFVTHHYKEPRQDIHIGFMCSTVIANVYYNPIAAVSAEGITIDSRVISNLFPIDAEALFTRLKTLYPDLMRVAMFLEVAYQQPLLSTDLIRCEPSNLLLYQYAVLAENALSQQFVQLTGSERDCAREIIQESNSRKKRPGYVYLLQSTSGYYKIGRTANPDDRMKTFGVKLPFEVEFEALCKCDDMYAVEKAMHDLFAHEHVNGEWFSFSGADIALAKRLLSKGSADNHG